MSSLDALLSTIADSVKSASESLELVDGPSSNEIISSILSQLNMSKGEGVSLLTLKNEAMLSYLNNLVLIILAKLNNVDTDAPVENTVVERVVLERGVKPLEKKLQYQLEKLIRSYQRMETEYKEKEKKAAVSSNGGDDSEESDSDDELNYRPNAGKITAAAVSDNEEEEDSTYKPPKIAAALPPSSYDPDKKDKVERRGKLQAMEEYLRESSDMPELESSVGANILENGRGGVKTFKEVEKEREVQVYEESNFTRLAASKRDMKTKNARKRNNNIIGGEDFSIFGNNRELDQGTKRKKPRNAWDRAKKKL